MNVHYPNIQVDVVEVTNYFFGPRITVSGLLTGQDIIRALKDRDLGSELLLPINVLRSGEDVLLDDVHVKEIEKTLQVPVLSLIHIWAGEFFQYTEEKRKNHGCDQRYSPGTF